MLTSLAFYNGFLMAMLVLAAIVFVTLFYVDAGYGQYFQRRWGPAIDNRLGWVLMESPVVILFFLFWITSPRRFETAPLALFLLFNLHYVQRAFVFPLLIRGRDVMPFSIILSGVLFNSANAYMQGMWIFHLAPVDRYTISWLGTPQFIVGTAVFLCGWFINLQSDAIIRNLRTPGDTAFHIPRGGMFRYVTAANYLGEFVEWLGWALLTWSQAGLVFAIWTFANLGPRAHRHHLWYRQQFGDAYPPERRRMIPFLY